MIETINLKEIQDSPNLSIEETVLLMQLDSTTPTYVNVRERDIENYQASLKKNNYLCGLFVDTKMTELNGRYVLEVRKDDN